ncbi:uncharacterized protein LOC129906542 isoform X2 [Episyrphus balteatus]|uniref:uncharacterized protein LOC129906542 isoform X2 n=1 Tax=Episyrphus balteatus TaxID=286459 RepID=UPI00248594AD|nr:uncharacterized protein LOC129906542 isoform X2 [Episyrphus balteatus]
MLLDQIQHKDMYASISDSASFEDNFIDIKWWKKYSCVAGNRSRSSKQKNHDNEPVHSKVPPPPPPRRYKEKDRDDSSTRNKPLSGDTVSEAFTLYSIRQQMAISLNRMKDLEEQVKSIPELQNQLTQLRNEKLQLQQDLKNNRDELFKIKEQAASPPILQIYSSSSPRHSSPVTFTPQRISPVSLDSLGTRLKSNSPSPCDHIRSSPQILKRDVGSMCVSYTRDIGIGSNSILCRSIGTNTLLHSGDVFEKLYTKQELNEHVQAGIKEYKEKLTKHQQKEMKSVGTQIFYDNKKNMKNTSVQTNIEPAIKKFSVGIMARPSLRDVMISCKPEMKTISCSDHRTTDQLCDKCDSPKKSVASGTEIEEEHTRPLSLKLMDMPSRSNTFCLGENEKLNIKRKTIGIQSQWTTHSIGMQTSFPVSSVGVQNVPQQKCEFSQCNVQSETRQTDTHDLIRLKSSQMNTDEHPQSMKPITCNNSCNTDRIYTIDHGVNTLPQTITKHSSSNTEQLHTRDIGCGDIVKPHISIACADNYCDSCKDAIKHLAKDFSKIQAGGTSLSRDSSKIPRPKHLSSPSPVRKKFMRQNTYTITPPPTPLPVVDKKIISSLFDEKPSHHISLDSISLPASPLDSIAGNESSKMKQKHMLEEIASENDRIRDLCHEDGIVDIKDDLIVKEETRVRISWSRENSPAPSTSTSSTVQTVVEKSTLGDDEEKKHLEGEVSKPIEECPTEDFVKDNVQKNIEPKKVSSQRSQREVQTMIMNQIVSQETAPREKIFPSKEMQAALKVINDSLQKFSSKSSDHKSATAVVQTEWFHVSSTDKANPLVVEDYLDCFEEFSIALLKNVVNLMDTNGNTAMHYAVSHGNFDVVSILLDSKVCNVNQMNNAGYTCVMLVSLAKLQNSAHRTVVQRLFQMADVNIRAKKHCQTALMLAVSHGNLDMVEMLLDAGADINIQDEDGSTALMCAAEHGRVDIVKHLLSQSDCDSLIQDVDGSTAFKIAWQAGHRDIGLLLYVHEQMLRSKMPTKPEQRTSSQSPRHHKRHPSQ